MQFAFGEYGDEIFHSRFHHSCDDSLYPDTQTSWVPLGARMDLLRAAVPIRSENGVRILLIGKREGSYGYLEFDPATGQLATTKKGDGQTETFTGFSLPERAHALHVAQSAGIADQIVLLSVRPLGSRKRLHIAAFDLENPPEFVPVYVGEPHYREPEVAARTSDETYQVKNYALDWDVRGVLFGNGRSATLIYGADAQSTTARRDINVRQGTASRLSNGLVTLLRGEFVGAMAYDGESYDYFFRTGGTTVRMGGGADVGLESLQKLYPHWGLPTVFRCVQVDGISQRVAFGESQGDPVRDAAANDRTIVARIQGNGRRPESVDERSANAAASHDAPFVQSA